MAVIDYITKSELRNFANDLTFDARTTLRKSAEARSPAGATFLSHSSKDDDLVVGAIRVLEGHGATVYVDEIDQHDGRRATDLSNSKCARHRLGIGRHNAQADHEYHADRGGGESG